MALLWFDGFNDSLANVQARYVNGSSVFSSGGTNPRTGQGNYGYFNPPGGTWAYVPISVSGNTVIYGCALRKHTSNAGAVAYLLKLQEGTTDHITLGIGTDLKIKVYRGTTLLGSSTTAFTYGTAAGDFHFIELKVVFDNTAGSIEVRYENNVELSLTGIDTVNGGSTGIPDRFAIGTDYYGYSIDDLYILDGSGSSMNDFLSNKVQVHTLFPDGAGDVTGWTPSSGANYTCVDETAYDSDSTYVEATTSGTRDLYAFGNLTVTPESIKAVRVNSIAKDSAGVASLKNSVRSGSTDSDGSAAMLTTSYAHVYATFLDNPDTSSAWTESAVNALQAGPKVA